MLNQAEKRLSGLKQVKLVQGDVSSLKFPDRSFDIVLSMNGFHAFPDKRSVFRETYRVLKHGGRFIGCYYVRGESKITDSLVANVLVRKQKFAQTMFSRGKDMKSERELRLLTKQSQEDGFRAVFTQYSNYVGAIIWERIREVGSPQDAEEAVSDVFADLFRNFD